MITDVLSLLLMLAAYVGATFMMLLIGTVLIDGVIEYVRKKRT